MEKNKSKGKGPEKPRRFTELEKLIRGLELIQRYDPDAKVDFLDDVMSITTKAEDVMSGEHRHEMTTYGFYATADGLEYMTNVGG